MRNKIVAIAGHAHSGLACAISSALQNKKDFVVNNHEIKDQMRQEHLNSKPKPIVLTRTQPPDVFNLKSGRENRRERRAKERKRKP